MYILHQKEIKGNVETKQKSKNAVMLGSSYYSFVNIFHNWFFKD